MSPDSAGENTAPTTADPRPKGGPQILVLMIVVLAPAMAIGTFAGAGPGALIGAFVALFGLIASLGGPLRADLRSLAAFAPLFVFAAVVPRLLGEVSRPAAFALITVLVVVSALLPLRGPRFVTTGLGLGMLPLLAYGIPLNGPVKAWQLLLAAGIGVLVAFALRLVMGIADPSAATRKAAAGVLDGDDPSPTAGFDLWLADNRPRWLGQVLVAASRYRLAIRSAEAAARPLSEPSRAEATQAIEQTRTRAGTVAELVRGKDVTESDQERLADQPGPRHETIARHLDAADAALDDAIRAATARDDTPVPLDDDRRDRLRLHISVAAGARFRSIQVRHAARTGLGVLIVLLVSLFLPAGDPLVPTLLMTTFGILQTSWQGTLAKARPRIIGTVFGAIAAIAIVSFVPPRGMAVIAVAALVIGLWNLTARPIVGYAGLLCMSVGINSALRDLDPGATLLEYVALTAVALFVGVVVGFAVVPGVAHRPLAQRVDHAVGATAAAIRALINGGGPDRVAAQRDAVLARQELVPDRESLTKTQTADLALLQRTLDDLAVLSLVPTLTPEHGRTDAEYALGALEGRPAGNDGAGPLTALAEQAHTLRHTLVGNAIREP